MPYGLRLLECVCSPPTAACGSSTRRPRRSSRSRSATSCFRRSRARRLDCSPTRFGARDGALTVFGHEDWMAPVASGSNSADAMAICPCTMGTLGAIAGGLADNLIERAADVMLKERRPLVLVPRETPLSAIHLENMLKLARAGAAIVPPAPGFYDRPRVDRRSRRFRRRARARSARRSAHARAALGRRPRRSRAGRSA